MIVHPVNSDNARARFIALALSLKVNPYVNERPDLPKEEREAYAKAKHYRAVIIHTAYADWASMKAAFKRLDDDFGGLDDKG